MSFQEQRHWPQAVATHGTVASMESSASQKCRRDIPQTVWCPSCGAPQISGLSFCVECGRRLPAEYPASDKPHWFVLRAAVAAVGIITLCLF